MLDERVKLLGDESLGYENAALIRKEATEVVSQYRFSVLELYYDLLDKFKDNARSLQEIYKDWKPDLSSQTLSNQGSDCFGLAFLLQERLKANGIKSHIFPFSAKGLPAGQEAKDLLLDIGSVGVLIEHTGNDFYFVDPGFALVEPITFTKATKSVSYRLDGRVFHIDLLSKDLGIMNVVGDDGLRKEIDFRPNQSLNFDALVELQKRYLQIRPTIHIERFNELGEKIAGIKIQMLKDEVVIANQKHKEIIKFQDWDVFDSDEIAIALGVDSMTLKGQVSQIITHAHKLRSLWVSSLRKTYAEKHYSPLKYELRSWSEAKKDGYTEGGVVIMMKNPQGQLLMYQVPESREKPKIGRLAGQYNLVVETAEGDEDFESNFNRALVEELGLNPSQVEEHVEMTNYAETDYINDGSSKSLARCVVCKWNGDLNHDFSFSNKIEGGKWKWVPIEEVMSFDLEPNIRGILERHILEGLL